MIICRITDEDNPNKRLLLSCNNDTDIVEIMCYDITKKMSIFVKVDELYTIVKDFYDDKKNNELAREANP
jgi:hypothetical protein